MVHLENAQFRAVAGKKQGFGTTPHEALDALMAQIPADETLPIAILPFNRGDAFFTQAQHDRLQDLKARQSTLTPAEVQELDALIEAEFDAAIARQKSVPQVKT
ncbi:MAG: hypothetical protein OHK0029_28430 [Armatimonadaceae bacterium]